MTYKIFHGPDVIHFNEGDSTVVSGQPNQETFTDENKAIGRLLELDPSFFPVWDEETPYMEGDRVMFEDSVYRALQDTEAAVAFNRTAQWAEVYDPDELNEEEESDGGPV